MQDLIGRTLGHYGIAEKIGEGGMGEVYRAVDERLGRTVAVKVLRPELEGRENARRRFLREARMAATIVHPFVCSIHDVGEQDGEIFFVMEHLDGVTLKERMADGAVPVQEALVIAREVAEALASAHAVGVVHRDLTPSNIFVLPDGHVKVADFGLARDVRSREISSSESTRSPSLTQPGALVGTFGYMSPEQVRGIDLDHQSDIFSLGILLYEMVAGVHPFRRETNADTMNALLAENPAPVHQFRNDVPDEVQRILNRTLDKDRRLRCASVKDLVSELMQAERSLKGGALAVEPDYMRFDVGTNRPPMEVSKRIEMLTEENAELRRRLQLLSSQVPALKHGRQLIPTVLLIGYAVAMTFLCIAATDSNRVVWVLGAVSYLPTPLLNLAYRAAPRFVFTSMVPVAGPLVLIPPTVDYLNIAFRGPLNWRPYAAIALLITTISQVVWIVLTWKYLAQ
jgi:serine/threonine protein kinase